MFEMLDTVRQSFQQAWNSLHALDARLPASLLSALQLLSSITPGSPLTQSLMVGALVGFLAYKGLKKRYRLPPGPFAWPLLGNLLWLNRQDEALYAILARWAKEKKYGPVVSLYFGPVLCVTLNDKDVVREALVEKGGAFAGRPSFHSFNVLTEGGKDIAFVDSSPAWKLHRRLAMQALRHYMRGSHLEKVVHHVVNQAINKMAAEPGPLDPSKYTSGIMFHVINTICFGEHKPFDDPDAAEQLKIFDDVNDFVGNGFLEDIIPLLKYWPTKKFRRLEALLDLQFKYIYGKINWHRATFSETNIRDLTDSILLAQSEALRTESAEVMAMFTDTHVGQTIIDIFAAGVDTSRFTLNWALLFMAGHPQVQERVQEEIDQLTGSRLPGIEDRSRLRYTEAVLCEALRLGTVVPTALPHKTLCDTTVGGYDVPEGTLVLVNQWALLRDPQVFDEPMEFKPERFLDANGDLKKQDWWTPFSKGKRVCLGENVARPQLILILACLLKRFTVALPPGQPYDPTCRDTGLLAHIPKPYKIVVSPR